jgi:tRNA(Arg) A34 adenosine deaminase TadA
VEIPVGSVLIHADGQTARRNKHNTLFVFECAAESILMCVASIACVSDRVERLVLATAGEKDKLLVMQMALRVFREAFPDDTADKYDLCTL